MTTKHKVWLITGASGGLGLATVKELLAAGYRVAATTRGVEKLRAAVGSDYDEAQFFPLAMQVTDEAGIKRGIDAIIARFGRIDVVVNNAGYILVGAIEELSDAEIRANFDINVFGTMNVIRAVMPHFRTQQSGYFLNIASISGSTTAPGQAIYSASKAAVILLTEAVSARTASPQSGANCRRSPARQKPGKPSRSAPVTRIEWQRKRSALRPTFFYLRCQTSA